MSTPTTLTKPVYTVHVRYYDRWRQACREKGWPTFLEYDYKIPDSPGFYTVQSDLCWGDFRQWLQSTRPDHGGVFYCTWTPERLRSKPVTPRWASYATWAEALADNGFE